MKTALISALALILTTLGSSAGFVSSHEDETPPKIKERMRQPAVLVFSKTRSFRHDEGIAGADLFFVQLADSNDMGIFTTENAAVFNEEQLGRFDLVVFNNMTGDTLSPKQELAFQSWLERGGALIALHGSGDASHADWPWYDEQVIGPEFIGHPARPQFQESRVVNLASAHPIMSGLPDDWMKVDEWYSFNRIERLVGATPLLGLDESTYIPEIRREDEVVDLRMGEQPRDHPIAWSRCIGEGRVVYSALGHHPRSYRDENYRRFLANAFEWVRRRDDGATGC